MEILLLVCDLACQAPDVSISVMIMTDDDFKWHRLDVISSISLILICPCYFIALSYDHYNIIIITAHCVRLSAQRAIG